MGLIIIVKKFIIFLRTGEIQKIKNAKTSNYKHKYLCGSSLRVMSTEF